MIEDELNIKRFGLVGTKLAHSFSKTFFDKEYHKTYPSPAQYTNYELASADQIVPLAKRLHLCGLNVTLPFKQSVIPYLNSLSPDAQTVGAVNTILFRRLPTGIIATGYNTDAIAFEACVEQYLPQHGKALVLGTGGAAKAVAHVLKKCGLTVTYVSRNADADSAIGYNRLTAETIAAHTVIINATPCGTLGFGAEVDIPYNGISERHLCFDLVYNPPETLFVAECRRRGAIVQNGLQMLCRQAEESWKIWNGIL